LLPFNGLDGPTGPRRLEAAGPARGMVDDDLNAESLPAMLLEASGHVLQSVMLTQDRSSRNYLDRVRFEGWICLDVCSHVVVVNGASNVAWQPAVYGMTCFRDRDG
jgi:hypothetical protein